eukprot:TRINITY_DN128_c0_g2_i1.p1 TRINITY_DN128_c0_g2~~TRINITY_DN128_c0_g2_i1.p1  ORF type:complete len:129 (-),score=31.58 TRINITY_DN128_c0_g2_i1:286-672(-)
MNNLAVNSIGDISDKDAYVHLRSFLNNTNKKYRLPGEKKCLKVKDNSYCRVDLNELHPDVYYQLNHLNNYLAKYVGCSLTEKRKSKKKRKSKPTKENPLPINDKNSIKKKKKKKKKSKKSKKRGKKKE